MTDESLNENGELEENAEGENPEGDEPENQDGEPNVDTLKAQKDHWREKAKKFEAQLKEKEAELPKAKPKEEKKAEPPKEEQPRTSFDDLVDNLSAVRNLNDDEITALTNQAKGLGVDPVKFIKSDVGKAYLESYKAKKKAEEATPPPSQRAASTKGSPSDKPATIPSFTEWKAKKGSNSNE